MRTTDQRFSFGAQIVKAEQDKGTGEWTFEGIASLPGRDLQGEEVSPQGLEIDYLLGKGLPPGGGGYINYDHDNSQIVGIPLDGKITPQGFWLKWKALNTPFMRDKVIPAMQAMKEAGWPRRYGMSIEGVVKERDPLDPARIKRAFIRNVALTPTPVHPGTFVDFAKSLTAGSVVEFRGVDERKAAVTAWVDTVADVYKGLVRLANNPYLMADGRFRGDQDVAYFRDVHGLSEQQAMFCARFALSRQDEIHKALGGVVTLSRPRGHPFDIVRAHLQGFKRAHPECPHVASDGHILGGLQTAARHFYGCERRNGAEVNAILDLLRDSKLLEKKEEDQ